MTAARKAADAQQYTIRPLRDGGADEQAHQNRCLLCIDLQKLCCLEDCGIFDSYRKMGIPEQNISAYLERVRSCVVPNVSRLQRCYRELGHEVIHTRIQSLTKNGRDRSPEHKHLGLHAPPGSRKAEFLGEVRPAPNEIVLDKTASGVFTSTNIEYVLRNLRTLHLTVVGVCTNECVSSSVRSAADLGFEVTLIADATAAITEDLHEATLLTTRDRYARVMDTDEAIQELEDIGAEIRNK